MPHRLAAPLLSRALTVLAFALLLPACGDGEKTRTIGEVKEVGGDGARTMRAASSEERFGRAGHGMRGGAPAGTGPRWAYETPEGWETLPPAPGRDVGWKVPGEALCTFTALAGNGGGLEANVNRWRKQMQLEPVDAETVAALPTAMLLGQPAKLLELEGTYVGMGRGEPQDGAKMLGVLAVLPNAAVFLKMTGPAEAVDAQKGPFAALASSIRPAPAAMQGMPPGHGTRPSTPSPSGGAAAIAWELPEGWSVKGGKTAFREGTFQPSGAPSTQAWISVLAGDGGGLVENINRWRGQMGQTPLSPPEVDALPQLEAMGGEGTVVTIEGAYNAGMGGGGGRIDDATMLGFALLRGDDSVFVKMIGPSDEVMAQKEAFEALCRSLREP